MIKLETKTVPHVYRNKYLRAAAYSPSKNVKVKTTKTK